MPLLLKHQDKLKSRVSQNLISLNLPNTLELFTRIKFKKKFGVHQTLTKAPINLRIRTLTPHKPPTHRPNSTQVLLSYSSRISGRSRTRKTINKSSPSQISQR